MRLLKRRASLCIISQTSKKICIIFICLVLCLSLLIFQKENSVGYADGRAECVMELNSGKILSSRNKDLILPMASTTKIMTALIIIEDCNLEEEMIVPFDAVGVEGSSIYLKKGELISVKDLLYGLMLRSGNDAATALAIHHSGNITAFAEKMNGRADIMGLKNTHFTNPSGLPDDAHYTTASDLCKIACFAMKNTEFRKIVSTRNYTGKYRSFVNKNKILNLVEGANGVKTGYTMKAGRCLVSSAERGGMNVICVVLNCPDMYERSAELLNQSFLRYEVKHIDSEKIFMCGEVPCKLLNNCQIVVEKDEELTVVPVKTIDSENISIGDFVGQLEIYCKNNLIFSEELYSIVNRNHFFEG